MMKGKICEGYLTVYLTITLALVLSLCLALIEGVRSNGVRVQAECVAEIGLNSILAEYHRELFKQYNLLAIDSSYGTVSGGPSAVEEHLQGYLEKNLSLEEIFLSDLLYRDFLAVGVEKANVTGVSTLTDGRGSGFRNAAIDAVRDDCSLTLLEDLQQWIQVIEEKGLATQDIAEEKAEADRQLDSCQGTVQVENPTAELEKVRKAGILNYVLEAPQELSRKGIVTEGLTQDRIEKGLVFAGNLHSGEPEEELMEKFLFREYLIRYMGHYGKEKEASVLNYQTEYLLFGNDTDVINLKRVVNTICGIREAANAMYLYSDRDKCALVDSVSMVLTTILMIPEAAPALKTSLILGWAYAESLYDVKQIMCGNKIPLIKDKRSWHYGIEKVFQLGSIGKDTKKGTGLGYEDYLRILLMAEDTDTLTMRAMNLVEADIRVTPGNRYFRLDWCFDKIEVEMRFVSKYCYFHEVMKRKEY